jgi:hypothetical protein
LQIIALRQVQREEFRRRSVVFDHHKRARLFLFAVATIIDAA